MPRKKVATAALLALTFALPTLVQGLDLGFLDQAPIRFFNAADMDMMEAAADEVLDSAADGEGRDWRNDQSGNSGSVKAIRSFTKDGNDCRRVEVVNNAAKATKGSNRSQLDLCKIESTWKIVGLPK